MTGISSLDKEFLNVGEKYPALVWGNLRVKIMCKVLDL